MHLTSFYYGLYHVMLLSIPVIETENNKLFLLTLLRNVSRKMAEYEQL